MPQGLVGSTQAEATLALQNAQLKVGPAEQVEGTDSTPGDGARLDPDRGHARSTSAAP